MDSKNKVLRSVAGLVSLLGDDRVITNKELLHISEVIDALVENPKSVKVNRTILEVVWPNSEDYLSVDRGGKLVVLVNVNQYKKRNIVKDLLVKCGIKRERICILCSDDSSVELMVSSNNCRAVIYSKDIQKKVIEFLTVETSVAFQNIQPNFLKRAVAELAQKLN